MIIDPSGRGPTMRQLLVAGVCGLIVFALILGFLMARYRGYFVPKVHVVADVTNTGDGLPSEADVKFRGVLVGAVKDVDVVAKGERQKVRIDLKPEFASGIPSNVTARVVPSNLFAVTSVELVPPKDPADNGLHEGSTIEEDLSQGTIALQDTLTKVRTVLTKLDPVQFGRVLGTLSQALDGSGRMPGSTIERLDKWLTSVDESIPNLGVLLDDFSASAHALNESAPELLDVLGSSVRTAQTIADHRSQLIALISGTAGTVDSVNSLFARNGDVGKQVTAGTSDMFGALAADANSIPDTIASLNNSLRKLSTTFHWGPQRQMVWNAGATLTPYRPYEQADCPRYGNLAGPSCATAPVVSDPGYLPDSMKPRSLETAQGLAKLPLPAGFPEIPGLTSPGDPLAAASAELKPTSPFAGTPLEGLFPNPAPPAPNAQPSADQPAAPAVPVQPASAPVTAGPISYQGDAAIVALLGRRPTAAEYLLLSSAMRGGTLQVGESGTAK
ncbi:MCE family protein [Nocardia anaemiae]|uniref:MCE family protein n=1 Tax=Nocardia anaemiae TaxID=263910 RepID=UPI0007A49475|nr:MCE family protein [Nocardia anaemiae]